MVEILIAQLKQEDEDCENEFVFQGVVSSVFTFLSKNRKFFDVLERAYLPLDCFPRFQEHVQGHGAEKSTQIIVNNVYQCVIRPDPYKVAMMTITRILNILTPCCTKPSA